MAARADPDRDRIDRAIQVASWLGAAVMFAYGAALSFDVLHTIAQAAGLSPVLAWLWPLGFETFMAVAAVAVLAEQRTRPGRTPWYPWALTALAAGSSIALNFGHPYIPLDPPPRLLVACVYGVPPICAPFAWHLFLLRLAHRRHQDDGQHPQDTGQDPGDSARPPRSHRPTEQPATMAAANASAASNGQDGEPSRTLVQVLLAGETQDRPVSWQDVARPDGAQPHPRLCAAARGTRPPGRRQRPPTHPRPGSQGAMTPPHPRPQELSPMPTPGSLSDPEAAHRRAWLRQPAPLEPRPDPGLVALCARGRRRSRPGPAPGRGAAAACPPAHPGHRPAPGGPRHPGRPPGAPGRPLGRADRQPADLGRDHPDALTAHLRGRPITLDYAAGSCIRRSCRVRGGGSGGGPPSPGILATRLARGAVVQVRHAAPESSAMGRPGSSAAESSRRRRRHHPAVEFGRLPRSCLTEIMAGRRPCRHVFRNDPETLDADTVVQGV